MKTASPPWWRGAVIYQIYPRSFADADGDGIGDLAGVLARLDHVARLGADAIWLGPVFVSPMADFGYDVADHCRIDPVFGSLETMDAVLHRAHALGLKVLLDQVWSHTSAAHPWFVASRASRSADKADWYVWSDPREDGTPPNNWLSVFGGAAWTWEPRRRQYYLHHFLSSQPQLNLRHEAVIASVLDIGRFWLERGVDGFRMDAIDFLMHDPALRSNPARPLDGPIPAKPFGLQEHLHDMLQPDILPFVERIRNLLDAYPGRAALAEVSSQEGAFARVRHYTEGSSRLHMAYTLRPLRSGFDHAAAVRLVAEAAGLEPGWPCWSFSNHDVERAATRWHPTAQPGEPVDPRFARLILAMLLTLRGSVTLYQGDELGLPEARLEPHELRDPFGIAYWPEFPGRDGSRTPMPWRHDAPHAGFSSGTRAPWLPVAETHLPLSVDLQEADPRSTLAFCRRFLAFRRESLALRIGSIHPRPMAAPLVAYERQTDDERMLAVFNLSEDEVSLPSASLGVEWRGIDRLTTVERLADETLRLPPWGFHLATWAP